MYLHYFALLGRGWITEETVAHTNVRKSGLAGVEGAFPGPGSSDHVRVDRASSPSNDNMEDETISTDSDDASSFSNTSGVDSDMDEEDEDDDAVDCIDEDRDRDEPQQTTLTDKELELATGLPCPPTGSQPLSLVTVKSVFKDLQRQLELIFHVRLDPDLRTKVFHIVNHLGRQLGYYPTGTLLKTWITDETVRLLRAAVWNVLGHERGSSGSRSVQNLLSIHTMLLLLDLCGPRVSSCVDLDRRSVQEDGLYLRWSMVSIRFCAYSSPDGRPQFVVNIIVTPASMLAGTGTRTFTSTHSRAVRASLGPMT